MPDPVDRRSPLGADMRAPIGLCVGDEDLELEELVFEEAPGRRIATRYLVSIPIRYRSGGEPPVDATIADVSATGARVTGPAPCVRAGMPLQIELCCFNFEEPVTLLARIVRELEQGFAIHFSDPDPFLRVLLKVAALQLRERRDSKALADF